MINETVEDTKEQIYESFLYQLEDIDKNQHKKIYFHESIDEIVDDVVSTMSRSENIELIDDIGGEEDIEEGMIDRNADLTTQIAQIAYCCLEQELFNDDFMQELQTALNNETIDYKTARKLIKKIKENTEIDTL